MAENGAGWLPPTPLEPEPSGPKTTTNGIRATGKSKSKFVPRNELEEVIRDVSDAWETNSLVEDILDELPATPDKKDPIICTSAVALEYRREFRALGPEAFLEKNLDSGLVPARRLLSAFGLKVRDKYVDHPDEFYQPFLVYAMCRELSRRAKLVGYNSVDDAASLIQRSKNIIVLTGAGISTSLGIPDFRSAGTGLYSTLAEVSHEVSDPQEVFDINVFKKQPHIFYSVARKILPALELGFTPTHAFIKLLQDKGKLLTNYSQNIDNLESLAGIDPSKLVQCHGSFATATCQNAKCGYQCPGEDIFPAIRAKSIPWCPQCTTKERTTNNGRKRKLPLKDRPKKRRGEWGDDDDDGDYGGDGGTSNGLPSDGLPSNGGIMKPDITFFKEPLPERFADRLIHHDRDKVDLVIVIGTSLKVQPVSEIPSYLPRHVPQIYISRTPVSHINFDIELSGDCDDVVTELSRRLGWGLKHKMIPKNQRITVETDAINQSLHRFTSETPASSEVLTSLAKPTSQKLSAASSAFLPTPDLEDYQQDYQQDLQQDRQARPYQGMPPGFVGLEHDSD